MFSKIQNECNEHYPHQDSHYMEWNPAHIYEEWGGVIKLKQCSLLGL